jgi:hypothetical protein
VWSASYVQVHPVCNCQFFFGKSRKYK